MKPSFLARFLQRARTALSNLKNDWRTACLSIAVSRAARLDPAQRPVIFFNASTRIRGHSLNAAFSLLASWAVRLQGTPVIHFVCRSGMSHCLQGTKEENVTLPMPCRLCRYQSFVNFTGAQKFPFQFYRDESLASALQELNLDELLRFEQPLPTSWTVKAEPLPLGALVLPSVRWRLRRMTLADDEPTRFLVREFIQSAWSVACHFETLLERDNPQALVAFNGQTFPEATASWLAKRHGMRMITHEVSMYPLSGFFTAGEVTALPMPITEDFKLTADQDARLDELMQNRFQGKFSMAGIHFFPEMKGLDEAFQQKAAVFKQIVPVFTNVIFDTTQAHANAFFPDMFQWLDAVLEEVKRNPETLFVIRAHPDEARPGKTSRESVAMWVERSGADRQPNLVFIPPDQYVSSYELIRRSKFVMIYNSTIGLEASIIGVPVLCGGRARFTDFSTVIFPSSREDYLSRLREFLAADKVNISPEHTRNSRRFFYFHYFIASLRFGDFLEPAALRGFVTWKRFPLTALSPSASPTLRALLDGILRNGDFLLRE